MSDGSYGDKDRSEDASTRPIAGHEGHTHPQQRWPSAAQRREHPGASPQSGFGPGGYPPGARSGGAGAFVAALVATVTGIAVSVAASYAAPRLGGLAPDLRRHLYDTGLSFWLSSPRLIASADPTRTPMAFDTTSFVVTFGVATAVLLLLLWAVIGSVPGGRGGFSVFLAGWGATLLAGVAASLAGYVVAADRFDISRMVDFGFGTGGAWAIHLGWLVGLIAAIGHSLRRKTA